MPAIVYCSRASPASTYLMMLGYAFANPTYGGEVVA